MIIFEGFNLLIQLMPESAARLRKLETPAPYPDCRGFPRP